MSIPVWSVGQVLTASDVNTWLVPLGVYKGADESVTSSTTLQFDDALVLALAANAQYDFRLKLYYEGGTLNASDLKAQMIGPSGSSGLYSILGYAPASLTALKLTAGGGATTALGTNGAGNTQWAIIEGTISTTGTPGNLQLQWAQNTSSGTPTIVHAGSGIVANRIG